MWWSWRTWVSVVALCVLALMLCPARPIRSLRFDPSPSPSRVRELVPALDLITSPPALVDAVPGSDLHRLALYLTRFDTIAHVLVWLTMPSMQMVMVGEAKVDSVELPRLRLTFYAKSKDPTSPKPDVTR